MIACQLCRACRSTNKFSIVLTSLCYSDSCYVLLTWLSVEASHDQLLPITKKYTFFVNSGFVKIKCYVALLLLSYAQDKDTCDVCDKTRLLLQNDKRVCLCIGW